MEDWNRRRYEAEEQWKKIVTYAAIIAILVSCLGLFALTTLSVEQRIKEIGIRKVLGASVLHITGMLSKRFPEARTHCFCDCRSHRRLVHVWLVTGFCVSHFP